MGVFPFAKALSENNPTSAVCAQIEPEHFLILIGFARGGGVSRVSVDFLFMSTFCGTIYLRGSDAFPTGNCRGCGHHTVRITGNKSWLAVPLIKRPC